MKRYRRDSLTVVVYGPQGETHEQVITVNLYKDESQYNNVVVNFEGEWHIVLYNDAIGTWVFVEDINRKPVEAPKTINERTMTLVGKVEKYYETNTRDGFTSTVLELIKEMILH